MSNYIFEPSAQASLPIRGSDKRFPVRRVYCVGRNYAAHAIEMGHPENGAIWLKVNDEIRQQGDLNQMIWKVPEIIVYLSGLFELAAGDVILSGTPAGVGPVERGDRLEGHIDGVGDLHCPVL